jgi:hypothetical protein
MERARSLLVLVLDRPLCLNRPRGWSGATRALKGILLRDRGQHRALAARHPAYRYAGSNLLHFLESRANLRCSKESPKKRKNVLRSGAPCFSVVNKKEHQKGTCGVVKVDNQNSPPKYGSHRRVRPFFLCSKISGFESLNYTPLHASQSFITHYPWMRFQTELSKKHFCITASLLLYPSIEHISLLTD